MKFENFDLLDQNFQISQNVIKKFLLKILQFLIHLINPGNLFFALFWTKIFFKLFEIEC